METSEETAVASGTLLRYLTLRLAGDSQAARLWLRPQDEASLPDLLAYHAAVPLRFAPLSAPDRYADRAGLVRRIASNAAVVDAALSITSPAGQGHRLIEKVDILKIFLYFCTQKLFETNRNEANIADSSLFDDVVGDEKPAGDRR